MGPGEPLWGSRGRRVHLPVAEGAADSWTGGEVSLLRAGVASHLCA